MAHIHTAPGQHDASVTAFIVRLDMGVPRLLLHMHRKLHTLIPPGGHVELDETPWAAVAREIEEEAGYMLGQLQLVQPTVRLKSARGVAVHPQPAISNTHSIPGDHFHTDLDYLFVTTGPPVKAPAETESQDLRWLNVDEITLLKSDEIFENVQDMSLYVMREMLKSDAFERVPATSYRLDTISR